MSIRVKESVEAHIQYENHYLVGPSLVECIDPKGKGYGDLLLMVDLFNASDSSIGTMLWRSCDRGKTFSVQGLIEKSFVYDFDGSWVKSGYGALYADEKAGVLLFIANDTYWEKGEIKSIWKKRTLYFRLSFDNGYTWTDKRYIIQNGKDEHGISYDSRHFLKDVTFGVNNAATISPKVVRAEDDTLLVGVQVQITDENGKLLNPTGMGYMKSGAIKGKWNREKLTYEWELGDYASVPLSGSTRGVYEPAFDIIDHNRVLMVMRGSNMGSSDRMDGVKFFSVSEDNGFTWTKPQPLKYDDGSTMYASSCIPKLLRHSNGKLYFVGVINESNPNGNLPRYPLCIAQIDDKRCCVIKDTVTVIDTIREHHKKMKEGRFPVDYSNHGVYEDKKTGEIVVFAPFKTELDSYTVLNKYVIEVESR